MVFPQAHGVAKDGATDARHRHPAARHATPLPRRQGVTTHPSHDAATRYASSHAAQPRSWTAHGQLNHQRPSMAQPARRRSATVARDLDPADGRHVQQAADGAVRRRLTARSARGWGYLSTPTGRGTWRRWTRRKGIVDDGGGGAQWNAKSRAVWQRGGVSEE